MNVAYTHYVNIEHKRIRPSILLFTKKLIIENIVNMEEVKISNFSKADLRLHDVLVFVPRKILKVSFRTGNIYTPFSVVP